MSLLMEALRKAEAAKRAGHNAKLPEQESSSAPSPTEEPALESGVPDVFKFTTADDLVALAPREEIIREQLEIPSPSSDLELPAATPATSSLDDVLDDYLTSRPEPELDEDTPQRIRERERAEEQRERAAAASMFNAKAKTGGALNRTRIQILTASMVLVAGIVAGTWAYLTTQADISGVGFNQSLSNVKLKERGFLGENPQQPPAQTKTTPAPTTAGIASQTSPPPTTTVSNTTAALPAPASPTPAALTRESSSPVQTEKQKSNVVVSSQPAATSSAPKTIDPQVTASASTSRPAVSDPQPTVVNRLETTTPVDRNEKSADLQTQAPNNQFASNNRNLEITRSDTANRIRPELQSAYNHLQRGNLREAEDLYQDLAFRFPNNRDALLGLASSKLQLGKKQEARPHYEHLLKLNPKDALARTGMLQSLPTSDPVRYEQDLVSLKVQFPELAPLSFALGNLYAQSNRWHEAQSAYFDALVQARRDSSSPVSPDYAYNLAVSLEQLGQQRAALEYYKQAETLAVSVKPGFDPMMLRQRLAALGLQQ